MPYLIKIRGYTLIECLIAVAILAAVTGFSIPKFLLLRESYASYQAIRGIADGVQAARIAAVKTQSLVTLCPSKTGYECSTDWSDGILAFVDLYDNQVPASIESILYSAQWTRQQGSMTWRAFRNRPFLQMTPAGHTRYQNGSFTWCANTNNLTSARRLILNRTGRMRFARDYDGDGIRESSPGTPIACS